MRSDVTGDCAGRSSKQHGRVSAVPGRQRRRTRCADSLQRLRELAGAEQMARFAGRGRSLTVTSNRSRTACTPTVCSISASCWPAHLRGPLRNGRKARGFAVASEASSWSAGSQRSGQNSLGREKWSGCVCMACSAIPISVPGGRVTPSTVMGRPVWRPVPAIARRPSGRRRPKRECVWGGWQRRRRQNPRGSTSRVLCRARAGLLPAGRGTRGPRRRDLTERNDVEAHDLLDDGASEGKLLHVGAAGGVGEALGASGSLAQHRLPLGTQAADPLRVAGLGEAPQHAGN